MAPNTDPRPEFELTTGEPEVRTFTVDEDTYTIVAVDYLSKMEESQMQARFSRFAQLAERLPVTPDRVKAERIASAMHDLRMEILTSLTDIPRELAEKLPLSGQARLMREIGEGMRSAVGSSDEELIGDAEPE